jgi:DNA primase
MAARLTDTDLDILSGLDEPGSDILRELVADLRESPCANTGQLLERWRDRPEAERLSRLAVAESLIPSDEAALQEVRNALVRMRDEQRRRRLDALLEREKLAGLSPGERAELQQLMSGRSRG